MVTYSPSPDIIVWWTRHIKDQFTAVGSGPLQTQLWEERVDSVMVGQGTSEQSGQSEESQDESQGELLTGWIYQCPAYQTLPPNILAIVLLLSLGSGWLAWGPVM